jgi:hypothetical protein
MALTPKAWRHARIVPDGKDLFSIVTHQCRNPFGPLAKKALWLPEGTITDRLPLAKALALGAVIERKLSGN